MLKRYGKEAPENFDEIVDSPVLLSIIIQLARIHGLHRDPKTFSLVGNYTTGRPGVKYGMRSIYKMISIIND